MVDLKKLVLISLASLAVACTGRLEPIGGEDDGDNGGPVVDAATPSAGQQEFNANVIPILTSAARDLAPCSSCHAGTTPPILFGADTSATLLDAYTTLLGGGELANPPANSGLFARGAHAGNALCVGAGDPDAYCTVDEVSIISAWIQTEITAGNVQ